MKRKLDSASRDISPPPNVKRPPPPSQKSTGSIILVQLSNMLAITSFFTPLTQKKSCNTKIDWQIRHETLLMGKYRAKDIKPRPTKIAAFDLVPSYRRIMLTGLGRNFDSCQVRNEICYRFRRLGLVIFQSSYKTKRVTFRRVYIPLIIKLMRYEIVIFSNQSRISFEPKAKLFPQWKQKLQAMAETVCPLL